MKDDLMDTIRDKRYYKKPSERRQEKLKNWLDSVNFNKENLLEDNPEKIKKYLPYIMNRCLAGHLDTVLFVFP